MKTIKTTPYTPTDISIQEIDKNTTRILAYPFENGYALTVAHPLRRLLLGSSVGFAPIAIRIEGVAHEFDSLRGMMEDVTLFIANLKQVRFKITSDEQRVVMDYSFSGPTTLKGSDLNSDEVEVVTPDQYIATINENGVFNFSVIIEKGIGFVPSEDIRNIIPDGFIPIDAYFTPVRKVTYQIENMLVDDDPNFEKIVLEIETDGQIDPLSAFNNALEVMRRQLSVFGQEWSVESDRVDSTEYEADIKELLQKIDTLGLSARSFNCLERANIKFIGEIILMSEAELKEVKNLGKKSTDEIKDKLEELGYPIGGTISPEILAALQKKLLKMKNS
ncbi:DNA-directed RNA polymerase subunit alpha [Helicobacter monodelphidis]|uniref:DNA-directed RNA polymerase subunit alpha n=1 Tax=Helicobacter sp. 15-1451 TaxID=2004995 RepID=UPI000DCBF21B|nr:DNA-directed RNA polymerase subunit alpha [Helicobacter sp. 15-1451]RAX57128.1 DNA-directed RNA polymerase subunit alpha [Helicobacter sp. 15-1451]